MKKMPPKRLTAATYVQNIEEDFSGHYQQLIDALEDPNAHSCGAQETEVEIEEQKVIVFFTFDCYSDEHLAELDRSCLLEIVKDIQQLKENGAESITFTCDDTYITMLATLANKQNYIKKIDYRIVYEKAIMECRSCKDNPVTWRFISDLYCNLETSDTYLSNLCPFLQNFHIDAVLTLLQDQSIESLFYKANDCTSLEVCQNAIYIYTYINTENNAAAIKRDCLTEIVKTWKELYKEGLQKVEIYRYVDTIVIVAQREGEPEFRREFNYVVMPKE